MNIRRYTLVKLVAIVLVISFSFENILWANPELFRDKIASDTLQVQSPFKPLANPQFSHQFLLKTFIAGAIKYFDSAKNINHRLVLRPYEGIQLVLNFDGEDKFGKHKEGENWIIPCSIRGTKENYPPWEYEAVINPDESISLRKPGEKEKLVEPDTDKQTLLSQSLESMISELWDERGLIREVHSQWLPAVTIFGSARIPETDPVYEKAEAFGRHVYEAGCTIRTGAGPSMMEAPLIGYIGAREESGAEKTDLNLTQGIRIQLPFEQKTSAYVEDNNNFNHDWDPKVKEILYSQNEAIQDDSATIDQFGFKNVGVYPQSRY